MGDNRVRSSVLRPCECGVPGFDRSTSSWTRRTHHAPYVEDTLNKVGGPSNPHHQGYRHRGTRGAALVQRPIQSLRTALIVAVVLTLLVPKRRSSGNIYATAPFAASSMFQCCFAHVRFLILSNTSGSHPNLGFGHPESSGIQTDPYAPWSRAAAHGSNNVATASCVAWPCAAH